jgi:hypothetical protein
VVFFNAIDTNGASEAHLVEEKEQAQCRSPEDPAMGGKNVYVRHGF